MSNICFIPARNSSTRFKNKNIMKFGKGNLITNTIDQAIDSTIFDRIIVSSNDESILNNTFKYCDLVDLHLRDDEQDQLLPVIRNAITDLKLKDDDMFCLLLVTCPLRLPLDIFEAYKLCIGIKNCVVSVKENENPIQMAFKRDAIDNKLHPMMPDDYYRSTRKQDHYPTYFYNDAIIFDTVKNFKDVNRRTLFGEGPTPYIMPPERSIAIDYKHQYKITRCLYDMRRIVNV